jgi:glycosyltransferase involved in cell wall biosynthesis
VLGLLDAVAIKASDVVVVDTEEHLAMLPEGADGVVVPVGAPTSWTAPMPGPRHGPLKVIFFGLFTPLQGAPVIGEALSLLDDERFEVTMVGGGQDLERTRALAGSSRARWADLVPPADLPAMVWGHDVCLGIFAASGKGTRVVPNKVFQGAAAGCCIVTSDTPPQRRTLGDAAVLVPAGDPKALAQALNDLADDDTRLLTLRVAAWELARAQFTPHAVTAPLYDRLSQEHPR